MSQINMKELYSTINEKTLKRMELYDSILVKCHNKILYNSKLQRKYCFYQIPEFIIGLPLYDVKELKNYIINSLKNNGFELLYIEPNWLFIYWNIKESKNLTKHTNIKKEINNHKYISTDTYKPSGNFIYENSSLMNMNDKFKS